MQFSVIARTSHSINAFQVPSSGLMQLWIGCIEAKQGMPFLWCDGLQARLANYLYWIRVSLGAPYIWLWVTTKQSLVNKYRSKIVYPECIVFTLKFLPLSIARKSPRGVVANVLGWDILVSEFKPRSRYHVHFLTNTLGEIINSLISHFGIK